MNVHDRSQPKPAASTQGCDESGRSYPLLAVLLLASTVGMVASSIYVPSVPEIAAALHTPVGAVQLTFVGYLVSFAVGMLILGPLSDQFGRRPVLLSGLALCALSSLVCAASPSIEFLIAARIMQGLGACAGSVVGRAIIRDHYAPEGVARVMAWLAFAITLMQAATPILGGHIQLWLGWRANFLTVALFAICALFVAARVAPATRPVLRAAAGILVKRGGYRTLVNTPLFVANVMLASGTHAGFHIFAAGAPAVVIGTYGIAVEQYGYYAALPPVGFLVGAFISGSLNLGSRRSIHNGSTLLVLGGFLMVALTAFGAATPLVIVGPMMLVCCGSGLVTPHAIAGALNVKAKIAGTASGLLSFTQLATAAIATAVQSLDTGSPLVLGAVIASTGILGVAGYAICHMRSEIRLAPDDLSPVRRRALTAALAVGTLATDPHRPGSGESHG